MATKERVVRVHCTVKGMEAYQDYWVDVDVGSWTVREFRTVPVTPLERTMALWVEVDSVAWHILDAEGKEIPHPGRGAAYEGWLAAYERMPFELSRWLQLIPYMALQEAASPGPKSADQRTTGGDQPAE